ncbi:MAG: hypothetical protein IKZ12_00010 [Alistipes sp.]|nr:hypothetical protein [Alistipes sp.]
MKYNKILSLLLSSALMVGFVACSTDDTDYYHSIKNDNPEREHMTHFRIEQNGVSTSEPYCSAVVEGTRNDIQLYWFGVKDCAGYHIMAAGLNRDDEFTKPEEWILDTIVGPEVLSLRVEDLQYSTTYRFGIKTLSKRGDDYNSITSGAANGREWDDQVGISTRERYGIPEAFWVENVTENSLRVRWNLTENTSLDNEAKGIYQVDENGKYIVDEILVEPSRDNPDAETIHIPFTEEIRQQGYVDVTGLQSNYVYVVNGMNNQIKRYWDRMYNTNMVRMKGDVGEPRLLKWEEWYDVNDINTRAHQLQAARIDTLLANYMKNNIDYAEGTIFELEPKKVYYLQNTVEVSKGFTLRCSDPDVAPEDRPLVYLGIGWAKDVPNPDPLTAATSPTITAGCSIEDGGNPASPRSMNFAFSRNPGNGEMGGINVQSIIFEDINFDVDGAINYAENGWTGSGTGNYFFNAASETAMPFALEEFRVKDCNFRHQIRGWVRFKGKARKQILKFTVDNCMFYDGGMYQENGRGYSWITGDGEGSLHNILKDFSMTNCTIVDVPRHALISENKNTAWDASVAWNIKMNNNTFINFSGRSKDRLIFEMRYAPANMTLECKNNLFVTVRKDANDKRKLYAGGMRIEGRTEATTYRFQDNYCTLRPDFAENSLTLTDWGQAITDYYFSSYNFSHTSRGANNKAAAGGGNQPTNGGKPADETKIKLLNDGSKNLLPVDLFEDPNPKSAEGEVGVHNDYRRHKLNIDNEHITHQIPDGFKVKPEYRHLMYTASGEPIGDPRWLK